MTGQSCVGHVEYWNFRRGLSTASNYTVFEVAPDQNCGVSNSSVYADLTRLGGPNGAAYLGAVPVIRSYYEPSKHICGDASTGQAASAEPHREPGNGDLWCAFAAVVSRGMHDQMPQT